MPLFSLYSIKDYKLVNLQIRLKNMILYLLDNIKNFNFFYEFRADKNKLECQ